MKQTLLLTLIFVCLNKNSFASEKQLLGSQLPELSKSTSVQISPSNDIDQGLWGTLEKQYPFKMVSTFDEHISQVSSLHALQRWYEEEKLALISQQNHVTTYETEQPTPMSRSYKIMAALKKITTGIIAPVGIFVASHVIPKQPELNQIKMGLQGSGLATGSYLIYKGLKQLSEPDAETLNHLKRSLLEQKRKVTTLKLYLNSSKQLIKKQTTFEQPKNTPATSGEFSGFDSSSLLGFTPIPE